MNVFISWSGPRSKDVAKLMDWWLSRSLHVTTWMSEDGIDKGSRWSETILAQLHAADVGIVCLTQSAQHSPWVLFETGVLLKDSESLICPVLIDIEPRDLISPFTLFQWTDVKSEEDRLKLLKTVNRKLETPLPDVSLEETFATWHGSFDERLESALATEDVKHAASDAGTLELVASNVEALREDIRAIRSALWRGRGTEVGDIANRYRTRLEATEQVDQESVSDARDGLTGLLNRPRLELAVTQLIDSQVEFYMFLIDIVALREVNSVYGFAIGDAVLMVTGERLLEVAPDADLVARIGADDFCVVVPHASRTSAQAVAEQLVEKLSSPVVNGTINVSPRIRVGVAEFPGDAKTHAELMVAADTALYRSQVMENIVFFKDLER